jgi:hypothetical protein
MAVFAWSSPEIYGPILEKLAQARPRLLGSETDELFSAIEMNMDYGVMGGENFVPSILPNGALLVRNRHRVISFDTEPSLIIYASPEKVRREFSVCEWNLPIDAEPYEGLSTIHRLQSGEVVWTKSLPERLSSVGQSVLLIGHRFDPSASALLARTSLMDACDRSRVGVVALRTFESFATVHRSVRSDDAYDTLLEEFAESYLEEMEEPQVLMATQHEPTLVERFHARALDLYNSSGMPTFTGDPSRHYIDQVAGAVDPRGWGGRKLKQCLVLLPIFARSPDMPAMPGFLFSRFYCPTERKLFAVLEFRYDKKNRRSKQTVDEFADAVQIVKRSSATINNIRAITMLLSSPTLEQTLLERPDTRSANKRQIRKTLLKWLNEDSKKAAALDAIAPVRVCLMRKGDASPSVETLEEWLIKTSIKNRHLTLVLTLPELGLRQEFRNGRAGEGNLWAFVSSCS